MYMLGLYENIWFFLILSPESIKKMRELYFTLYKNGGYVTMSFSVSNGGYENLYSYLWYSIAAPQNYGYNISRGLQWNYQCYICYIGLYSQLVFSRCGLSRAWAWASPSLWAWLRLQFWKAEATKSRALTMAFRLSQAGTTLWVVEKGNKNMTKYIFI